LLSLGSSKTNPTATKAIAIGIVGAAVAAPAGLADWRTLNDRQRRVGIVHAALNTTALTTYALSLLCRLLRIGPPRMLAFAGFGLTMASGYLGGELVYRLHAGVAQRPLAEPPKDFELALPSHELHEGEIRRIEIEGYPVMLTRQHGFIYALSDVCTHLACSLSEGHVEDQSIRCNCHGSRFSLADGAVINGPATVAETSFEVREYDSRIEVRLRRY
jgi:nitrite reductase/ring-hydroxylating ferredoxin subunit